MQAQISKKTLEFLRDLKKNNDRDWFNEHKPRYLEAKDNFETFVDALIGRIATFDEGVEHLKAKNCVFRIYRDVRFSKDKSPYKVHIGAHITASPKKSDIHKRAGYYIHVEPGGKTMLAGGAYLPESAWLRRIRENIYRDADSLKKILANATFKKYFGEMKGEKLSRGPKDFPKDHPDIELLKHKSFLATHKVTDNDATSKDFLSHCGRVFKALAPFDSFLNQV